MNGLATRQARDATDRTQKKREFSRAGLRDQGANTDAHTIFTRQWAIYRRFVDAGCMSRRAFFGILHHLVAVQ